jgi:hypothetical protein
MGFEPENLKPGNAKLRNPKPLPYRLGHCGSVVTAGDVMIGVGDGRMIVGDVLNVDGDVLSVGDVLDVDGSVLVVDGDVPTVVVAGPAPIAPDVPVTPARPDDDKVVVVGAVGVGDTPIELVGAGIVEGELGVMVDGDGDISGDVDGTGDANVVDVLGEVTMGVVTRLVVPTLGLDIVPGPGIHGYGATSGADGVDVVLFGSVVPA